MKIKNEKQLTSHGNKKGRKSILKVIKSAIESVNSYKATKKKINFNNDNLQIENTNYDLSKIENIYVIGGGKATYSIAKALDEILGDKITDGHVITKEDRIPLNHITVGSGGHPIPNKNGFRETKKIIKLAKQANKEDLVISTITGGASALMVSPAENINLKDIKIINELLLNCGAPIEEINTVRKHISKIKGGKLAKLIRPAKIVNMIVIDEIAGTPWGPTVADETKFNEAIEVLKKYELWKQTPDSIKNYLTKGEKNRFLETPNKQDFKDYDVNNIVLADINMACEAAKKKAEELGFNTKILTSQLEGESKEAGIFLTSIAKEIKEKKRPLNPPSIVILGGETTVSIKEDKPGEGGPSQEFVLSSALSIGSKEGIIISSIDTDGTDGPTKTAGGIIDNYTIKKAEEKEINIYNELNKHNSKNVLEKLGDDIKTSPTGTNVMNLYLALILR